MIEVRGPNVFQGYWRMPEKTAEELRPDGWFVTGDLGRFDDDGYLTIVGRQKDLIITGGYNVYPKEVELLLDDVPGVKDTKFSRRRRISARFRGSSVILEERQKSCCPVTFIRLMFCRAMSVLVQT